MAIGLQTRTHNLAVRVIPVNYDIGTLLIAELVIKRREK